MKKMSQRKFFMDKFSKCDLFTFFVNGLIPKTFSYATIANKIMQSKVIANYAILKS